ncbi:hypothetical protein [Photorhabdus laumondii]|uniref:hypothetical protein n=1 Tax=Photorhabdus laumondii TaxID=2218628 RepID=UPI0033150E18
MTGVSERSQQRGDLKDDGYIAVGMIQVIYENYTDTIFIYYTLLISRCITAARE